MHNPPNERRLRALAWEARQRGVSYGVLVAQLLPFEEAEILKRYEAAMEISSPSTSRSSRERLDWKEVKALYDQGCTDREITDRLGRSGNSVRSWRTRHGFPPNRRKKGGESEGS